MSLPTTGTPASPLPDLTGKKALVTGAASGIGRACAVRLAAAGASVVVLDLDADAAATVADQVGGTSLAVDLSERGFEQAVPADIDVLVNNAGFQKVAPLEDFPGDTFAAILAVMLEAPFRLISRSLPHMYAAGWGRVVNVSSVHGLRASPYKSAYVSAKHGLEGLSKVTALEGATRGVTSNCINPGYVRTPLVENQIADTARVRGISEEEVVETVMLERSPLKRLLEPEEVAEMAAFLCTPAASSITGTSMVMDGGWTAR